jgi:uncharacterized protein (TIGR03086 family)
MVDVAGAHEKAVAATGRVVVGIGADKWTAPTPCDGWNVRALMNHVVSGNWWAAELAAGRTIAEVGSRLDGDVLGDDPAGAYQKSGEAAVAVFAEPGALQAPCAVSYGPVPGEVYCGHRLLDVVIHGWDLAKATGQSTDLDPDLVQACWDVVEPQIAQLRGSGMFGDDIEVDEGADSQTRLLALLGRRP